MVCPTNSWYTRVPSSSNIGDGPSRLDMSVVSKFLKCIIKDAPNFKTFKGALSVWLDGNVRVVNGVKVPYVP
jgi:hypothetical protein